MRTRREYLRQKRHPQGHMVTDYAAEALARYGPVDKSKPLGTPGITDIRDMRDPAKVGEEFLRRNGPPPGPARWGSD